MNDIAIASIILHKITVLMQKSAGLRTTVMPVYCQQKSDMTARFVHRDNRQKIFAGGN